MGMVDVFCQNCNRRLELNEYYVAGMLSQGELVKGTRRTKQPTMGSDGQPGMKDHYEDVVYDVCRSCASLQTIGQSDPVIAQTHRIILKMNQLIESRPDLDADGRRKAALDDEFDPHNEKNPAFRAYLLEHIENDDTLTA